jgi:hypothetical protein
MIGRGTLFCFTSFAIIFYPFLGGDGVFEVGICPDLVDSLPPWTTFVTVGFGTLFCFTSFAIMFYPFLGGFGFADCGV